MFHEKVFDQIGIINPWNPWKKHPDPAPPHNQANQIKRIQFQIEEYENYGFDIIRGSECASARNPGDVLC